MVRKTYVIVSYDVTDDSLRSWLSDELSNLGLHREQYSLFSGKIPRKRIKSIKDAAERCRDKEDCKIRIIPLCKKCYQDSMSFPEQEEGTDDYTVI